MGPHPEYAVDIEKVVLARTGGKKPPRLLLKALGRFLHIDYINEFLSRGYEGVEFCVKCMEYMGVTIECEGLENIKVPVGAKLTFASNHPLGGIDGVALTGIVGTHFGKDIGLMINSFLMNLKGLAPMSVSIEKMGGQSRSMPEQIRSLYADKQIVMVFPAGQCSRKYNGRIQDREWSKSFITLSRDNGRWIVPVHFIGQNSKRFYMVDLLCRALGIKLNIPMFMLPGELYRARGKSFKVVFGKPLPPDYFDNSMKPSGWASHVRELVYELK